MKKFKMVSLIAVLLFVSALNYSMANSSETDERINAPGGQLCGLLNFSCDQWYGKPPTGAEWCGGAYMCLISSAGIGWGCVLCPWADDDCAWCWVV